MGRRKREKKRRKKKEKKGGGCVAWLVTARIGFPPATPPALPRRPDPSLPPPRSPPLSPPTPRPRHPSSPAGEAEAPPPAALDAGPTPPPSPGPGRTAWRWTRGYPARDAPRALCRPRAARHSPPEPTRREKPLSWLPPPSDAHCPVGWNVHHGLWEPGASDKWERAGTPRGRLRGYASLALFLYIPFGNLSLSSLSSRPRVRETLLVFYVLVLRRAIILVLMYFVH